MKRIMLTAAGLLIALASSAQAQSSDRPYVRHDGRVEPLPPISQERIDAAMAKLEQKQAARRAAAATQPSQAGTQDGAPAVREEVNRLRREVSSLKSENQSLRTQVDRMQQQQRELRNAIDQARSAVEGTSQNTTPYAPYSPPVFVVDNGSYGPWWWNIVGFDPFLDPAFDRHHRPFVVPPKNVFVPTNTLNPALTPRNYNLPTLPTSGGRGNGRVVVRGHR